MESLSSGRNEHFYPHPSIAYDLQASGIELPSNVEVMIDKDHRRIISWDNNLVYPDIEVLSENKHGLFLKYLPNADGLLIPDNSAGLPLVLNEAVGSSESLGVRPDESRTFRMLEGLFNNLFSQLRQMYTQEQELPTRLRASQLLVVKEDSSFRLLPPLAIAKTTNVNLKLEELRKDLLRSLDESSTTPTQQQFAGVLRGIIKINKD